MTPPAFPTDGLPRFKATDVNVLDRANCHRIVVSFDYSGADRTQIQATADRLNAGQPATAPRKPRVARTHCSAGHEYTPENTYLYGDVRACRTCRRLNNRMRKKRIRERAA